MITGKEALIALASGEEIECCVTKRDSGLNEYWFSAKTLTVDEIEGEETEGDSEGMGIYKIRFRLKPRTITINGIEVPECGKDYKYGNAMYILNSLEIGEYCMVVLDKADEVPAYWWRTEEEIKQVVAALRSIFK